MFNYVQNQTQLKQRNDSALASALFVIHINFYFNLSWPDIDLLILAFRFDVQIYPLEGDQVCPVEMTALFLSGKLPLVLLGYGFIYRKYYRPVTLHYSTGSYKCKYTCLVLNFDNGVHCAAPSKNTLFPFWSHLKSVS